MLPEATHSWTLAEAAHLIRRAGFGAAPGEIKRIHALGRDAAVDRLLSAHDPDGMFPAPAWADPQSLREVARQRMEQRREIQRAQRRIDPTAESATAQATAERRRLQQEAQRELRNQGLDIQRLWWNRILATRAPLREKMTLFWHDHFACSLQKVRQPALMLRQNELFRRHAFSSFQALTREIVTDPAMMVFLDVQTSKRGNPNENFSREVFELFTLGEGHYTEEDVREAARAFTGYQLNRITGTVTHNRRHWDDGRKTVFGKSGAFTGTDVINLTFERTEPSRFISRKLWEFFAYEEPPERAVDAMAKILRDHDHRIEPLLRAIFRSREFYQPEVIGNQIKSPVQFLAQMLHELEITEPPRGFLLTAQGQLGQMLYNPPNVAGWDHGKAWINTNTLLARYNLAGFIATGSETSAQALAAPGMRGGGMANAARRSARQWNGPDYEALVPRAMREDAAAVVDHLIDRFGLASAPPRARESFIEFATAKQGVVFTNKEIGELCHLMLSTPYHQLC
ncbi:MAG: DUF1800 domain-containing protein [Luteolibacter sp.]